MTDPVGVTLLRDIHHGGSAGQLAEVADQLAAFVAGATQSVDLAIYDFRLADPAVTNTVVSAFTDAADRGVSMRIGYDAGTPTASVWTGSTNFTDDAWTQQENNIITIASAPMATAYRTDFDLARGAQRAQRRRRQGRTRHRDLRRRPDGPHRAGLAGQRARHRARRHLGERVGTPRVQAVGALHR